MLSHHSSAPPLIYIHLWVEHNFRVDPFAVYIAVVKCACSWKRIIENLIIKYRQAAAQSIHMGIGCNVRLSWSVYVSYIKICFPTPPLIQPLSYKTRLTLKLAHNHHQQNYVTFSLAKATAIVQCTWKIQYHKPSKIFRWV